ncbi:MAG: class I SAM-dependent methyltransferase [Bacteroidota bacterium]|nr:class I SAM-dependent methyltransferase [Bacteroidota bacterium]
MDEQLYHQFFKIEDRHWWFVARKKILAALLQQRLPDHAYILDVGCGTGGFLMELSASHYVYGMDFSSLAVDYCHKRGLNNTYVADFSTFPHPELKFDLISFLDVIEHIDDDVAVLRTAKDYLAGNGKLLITVPAYQFLWSRHDKINHHRRRYTAGSLKKSVTAAGFSIEKLSYFNSILFPVAFAGRLAEKIISRSKNLSPEFAVPPMPINSILKALFSSERLWLRNFSFPFGLSVLCIAKKI